MSGCATGDAQPSLASPDPGAMAAPTTSSRIAPQPPASTPSSGASSSPGNQTPAQRVQRIQDTTTLVLGPLPDSIAVGMANTFDSNCVAVQPDLEWEAGFRVLSVNATLAWTPQTPQSEYLVLVIQSGNATSQGFVRYDSPSGTSPVTFGMDHPFRDDTVPYMAVGARVPGLTQYYLHQEVQLTLDVVYESASTDQYVFPGTCGYGDFP